MPSVVRPRPEDLSRCLDWPSEVVETALGPVEYAVRGDGPPLLSIHGGPGGFDQGLLLGEPFRVNGFRVIAPSRPGYLRTPLASGPSPEEQADLLAALLDALGIERAAVLGASAGGPAAYLLAARHPGRAAALLAVDAVSRTYTLNVSPLEQKLFVTTAGLRLMLFLTEHFPKTALTGLLQTESTLAPETLKRRVAEVLDDPLKRTFFVQMVHSFADRFAERKPGVMNDLERFAALGDLALSSVACPALILHGDHDNDVPPDHAAYAAGQIPGARLVLIEQASHLGFWLAKKADSVRETAIRWLQGAFGPL